MVGNGGVVFCLAFYRFWRYERSFEVVPVNPLPRAFTKAVNQGSYLVFSCLWKWCELRGRGWRLTWSELVVCFVIVFVCAICDCPPIQPHIDKWGDIPNENGGGEKLGGCSHGGITLVVGVGGVRSRTARQGQQGHRKLYQRCIWAYILPIRLNPTQPNTTQPKGIE